MRRSVPRAVLSGSLKAKAHNQAKLLVVDPRFTRTASLADVYVSHSYRHGYRFLGRLDSLFIRNRSNPARVRTQLHRHALYRQARLWVFEDGLFNGYDAASRSYPDKSEWDYELDENGHAKVDMTLQHPNCVYQLLKKDYSRYIQRWSVAFVARHSSA